MAAIRRTNPFPSPEARLLPLTAGLAAAAVVEMGDDLPESWQRNGVPYKEQIELALKEARSRGVRGVPMSRLAKDLGIKWNLLNLARREHGYRMKKMALDGDKEQWVLLPKKKEK